MTLHERARRPSHSMDMAEAWCDFYRAVLTANPKNPSAAGWSAASNCSRGYSEMLEAYVRTRLSNSRSVGCLIHLEPWGEIFELGAGSSFEVSARGPDTGHSLEFEIGSEAVTVHGWPGSVVNVVADSM